MAEWILIFVLYGQQDTVTVVGGFATSAECQKAKSTVLSDLTVGFNKLYATCLNRTGAKPLPTKVE